MVTSRHLAGSDMAGRGNEEHRCMSKSSLRDEDNKEHQRGKHHYGRKITWATCGLREHCPTCGVAGPLKQASAKDEKRSQKSSKKTAVKVVYISNPMKIKASPSEFRAVVQQLTGRYANSQPSPGIVNKDHHHQEEEGGVHQQKWQRSISDLSYEFAGCGEDDQVMDEFVVTPQIMLDGFSPLMPSHFGS
ncbi:hypothetical protein L1987_82209 [Smallanthus sonchifolius]|uniref:Uncharacterized protein n=1 Tax=Smallanthus sonchifolius TaxID=185202 RepID=A0ACB8YAT7_9ASTR|nr:hypothetical protein L1987_82209 [Smallanthus sonchifolius]